jgi:hypothetical protein
MRLLIVEPRLCDPWLSQRGADPELVYGLIFGHP